MNSGRCSLPILSHQAVQLMEYLKTGHELAALAGSKSSGSLVDFLVELAKIRVRDSERSDYVYR